MGNTKGKTVKHQRNLIISPFKIILIGDAEVGKTCILMRYAKNQFTIDYKPTKRVRIENVVKKVNLPSDAVTSVTMWDCPGTEDIDLKDTYYRDIDAAIVIVDMSNETSIRLAGAWKQEVTNRATRTRMVGPIQTARLEQIPVEDPASIPVLLVGNKYDKIAEMVHYPNNDDDEVVNPEDFIENNMPEDVFRKFKEEGTAEEEAGNVDDQPEFPRILGPKKDEKKPESVRLLEKVAEEYGFVGSVMVSARDGDPSVALAVQALARYLMQQHLPQKPRATKAQKAAGEKEEETAVLQESGDKEFDALFTRCALPLRRCLEYGDYYRLVLRRFKEQCTECGMIQEKRPSLEDCLLGIRRNLPGDVKLKIVEDAEFLTIDLTHDPRVKVPREVHMCLKVYNNEFVTVCRAVLRDGPALDALLAKLDGKIHDRSTSSSPGPDPRAVHIADQNRARIAFARKHIQETMEAVQAARQKTKAAAVW